MDSYKISRSTPDVETYVSLRAFAGLSAKTTEAAKVGLANTLFAVQVVLSSSPSTVVGMGRMIGDGGCFFQLTDMAVLPEHQGKGVGKMIMKEMKQWMDSNVPASADVLLFADGPAKHLYKQYGFVETADLPVKSVGMACMYEAV